MMKVDPKSDAKREVSMLENVMQLANRNLTARELRKTAVLPAKSKLRKMLFLIILIFHNYVKWPSGKKYLVGSD
jgi:hypothetical protein